MSLVDFKQLEIDLERAKEEENRKLRLREVRDFYRAHYASSDYVGRSLLYFGAQ